MLYDGFISYSHAREAVVARAIQSALHRFARPWYRLRALRVFRDVTNLSANPGLWSAIENALGETKYLLLLASPQSAASPWVQREVEWWLKNRPADHLLLVLVDGSIRWDTTAGDFDWNATTVLPRGLAGAFREEPLYVDFRGFTSSSDLSLTNPAFSDRIAGLAATLHGRPKDEMIGEDVRQHRRTMRVAWTAATSLAVLAGVAAIAAWVAVHQRNVAERERRVAEEQRRLAVEQRQVAEQQRNIAEEQRRVAEERRKLAVARELVARGDWLRGERAESHPAALLMAAEGLRRLDALGVSIAEADQGLRRVLALTPKLVATFQHDEPIVSFAFSRDGTKVAAGTRHGYLRVWTVGAEEKTLNFSHNDRVSALAFNPDGSLIASASWDRLAAVTDVASGTVRWTFRHNEPVWTVAFSPDGRFLTTAGRDGLGHVWDIRSGRELATLPHGGLVEGAAWSGDGRFLALQGGDGVGSLFDTTTLRRVRALGEPGPWATIAFSPDGRRLARWSPDRMMLLDLQSGRELTLQSQPLAAGVIITAEAIADAIAFSADSRWLYAVSDARVVRIIDAGTGGDVRRIPHDEPVRGLAANADNTRVATCSRYVARIWDHASGAELARLNHESIVTHMAFSANGLIATVAGSQVRLWREAPINPLLTLPHVRGVWQRLFSPDGRWLVTQDPQQVVAVWDAASGSRVAELRHPDLIRNVRFSSDGNAVATASNDRKVRVWELPSGRLLVALDTPTLPLPLAFSPDGARLATATGSGRADEPSVVLAWDWRGSRQILRRETRKECRDIAFSPDGRRIVFSDAQPRLHIITVLGDGTERILEGFAIGEEPFSADSRSLVAWRERGVALVDVETGTPRETLDVDGRVRSAAITPATNVVAIITNDQQVRVWSPRRGGRVVSLLHKYNANSARFSPDGRWLATGSGHPIREPGEARVWAVADGVLNSVQTQDRGVWVVDFSPDGARLATLGRDIPMRVWPATASALLVEANARATRNLSFAEWRQFLPDEPYPLLCDKQPVHPTVQEAVANLLLDGNESEALQLASRIVTLNGGAAPANAEAARAMAADTLVARASVLAREGAITRALEAMKKAQALNHALKIPALTWNQVAWAGSTHGHAREVLFAAQQAVELEPQNANFRDTRGLARALTGDIAGAIEDFKAFLAGAGQNYPGPMIEKRRLWLGALSAGKSPFTEEVLQALRVE